MMEPTNAYEILVPLTCWRCEELKQTRLRHGGLGWDGPEYNVFQVGRTLHGLQVWCRRHAVNVLNLTLDGQPLANWNQRGIA
jgi:hypothetical protein